MKSIKKLVLTALIGVMSLSIVACGGENKKDIKDEKNVKGFNYKITKGDEVGYIVATAGLVPQGLEFYNENIKKIIGDTDGLCVPLEHSKESEIYLQNAIKGDIKSILTPEEYDKLVKVLIDDVGFTVRGIEEVNAFGAMQYITMSSAFLCNYESIGSDIEQVLIQNYKKENKEVISLLTVEELYNPIIETYTTSYLKEYISKMDINLLKEEARMLGEKLDGYKSGDIKAFENYLKYIKESSPKEYDTIRTESDDIFNKMILKLESKKKYTYCLSTVNLVLEDGIIKKLESKGYKVERINEQ